MAVGTDRGPLSLGFRGPLQQASSCCEQQQYRGFREEHVAWVDSERAIPYSVYL